MVQKLRMHDARHFRVDLDGNRIFPLGIDFELPSYVRLERSRPVCCI
jgi:hypothetical protein